MLLVPKSWFGLGFLLCLCQTSLSYAFMFQALSVFQSSRLAMKDINSCKKILKACRLFLNF